MAHFWPFWAHFRIFWLFLAKLSKNVSNLTISLAAPRLGVLAKDAAVLNSTTSRVEVHVSQWLYDAQPN